MNHARLFSCLVTCYNMSAVLVSVVDVVVSAIAAECNAVSEIGLLFVWFCVLGMFANAVLDTYCSLVQAMFTYLKRGWTMVDNNDSQ